MGFHEKVSDIVDKGIAVSKRVVGQAGVAMQKFSDKSVVRLEKLQFETKRDSQIKELGRIAAAFFVTDGKSELRSDDPLIQEIIAEIKNCEAEISKREEILSATSEKTSESAAEQTAESPDVTEKSEETTSENPSSETPDGE